MKKLLSAALAILLITGVATTASADVNQKTETTAYSIKMMSDGGPPM